MKEGKQLGNRKTVTSPRPNIIPSPQKRCSILLKLKIEDNVLQKKLEKHEN